MPNHLFASLLPGARDLSRTCLISAGGSTLSYGGLDAATARYASALVAAAVRPGDRVAVQVEKSEEALFLCLACIRAGAVLLPLNTAYTLAELEYFVGDAEPTLLVGPPEQQSALAGLAGDGPGLRLETLGADGSGSLAALADRDASAWTDADCGPADLAAVLYTSGTTGRPKGAMLSHENLRSNAAALVETWHFSASDVLIHALPIFHTHGLFVATNVALMAGSSMIFLPKFNPGEVLDWMPKATVLMGVPTFYTRLLDEPRLTRDTTAGMRLFVSGSAPLLADTHHAFRERTGHAILERYGMTETGMNTSNPYNGQRVPGCVGAGLPGVEVRVTDPESGNDVPRGEIGMIEVRGPNVFTGYWRKHGATRESFRGDGFFITGDLGRMDTDDRVWIVGRGKDVVITGGYNVYPKEVELELDALAGVKESAVIGVPHRDFGEAVVAVVVPDGESVFDEGGLIRQLRERLAGYKVPKRIVALEELPRNTMAKVQKNVLRERHKGLFG
jgi:malonyl-CoA/methylmalonyl-CoA synthetase